jgi:peptide/nickel transport system substrate-binding protein
MRRSMRYSDVVSAMPFRASLLLALGVAGALGCRRPVSADEGFPREQTLYVGGFQWFEPSTFNPLDAAPAWPVNLHSGQNLFYEALLSFDTTSGQMQPLLAESYAAGADAIEVTLDPAARFADGSPVTADDVKYTYDLGLRYKGLRVATAWPFLSEVRADAEARRVTFVLQPSRKNPLVVLDSLQEIPILPRHAIEPLLEASQGDLNQFTKLKFELPVGSGPYTLLSYSAEKVVTVRRDDYWGNAALFGGKRAAPKYVIHPLYKSNDQYSVALQQGRLDISSSFMPRIWLKQRKGVRSWYDELPYFVPSAIVSLFLNVLHPPLGDAHFRRAMAFSINYDDIRELAVSGYSEPIQPGLILPFGFEGKYYSAEDAAAYGATRFDPERARAELSAGGYRSIWGSDGQLIEMRDAAGERVPTLYVKTPSGWTDWEAAVRIIVRSLRAVGIDLRERFIDGALYFPSAYAGDFDMIMFTPSAAPAPSKPWSRFDAVLSNQDFAPPGDKMYKDLGRFNDPKAPGYLRRFDELLDLIPTLSEPAAILAAYRELNVLFMQQQPVLPIVYRPDQFYEFSGRVWQGFPTLANPFLPPQVPSSRMGTRTLWHLSPAQAKPAPSSRLGLPGARMAEAAP